MINLNDIGAAATIVLRRDDGAFIYEEINAAAERMTGLSAATTVGRPLAELFPPGMVATLAANYAECMEKRHTVEFERPVTVPVGTIVTRITLSPIFDAPDLPVRRLLGVSIDITEQHRLQENLKTANARLAIAMEALGGAHWYFDNENQRFDLSPAFDRILGVNTPRDMGLDEWLGHVHPDDRDDTCFADILAGRLKQGTAEFRVFADNGDMRWLRCRRQAVTGDKALMGIAGVVLDVTQEKRREATLSHQAASDSLTGLANRRRFEEGFAAERQRAVALHTPLALLMVDVDHFKAYNDTYGHIAGDAVLRSIASCLQSVVARAGGMAARYGGEEFVAVLPDMESAGAALLAEEMLREIAALAEPHSRSPIGTISVSIGVASQTWVASKRSDDLVALADAALYRAKNDGRNCYRVLVTPKLRAVEALESSAA